MTITHDSSIGRSPWVTSGAYDVERVLSALSYLLTSHTLLCFEGTSMSKDVRQFFEMTEVPARIEMKPGTLFPKPSIFHVPYNQKVVDQLRVLSQAHAQPELFDHFLAYEGTKVILVAYDFGDDPILISESVSEQSVKAFTDALGCKYIKSP